MSGASASTGTIEAGSGRIDRTGRTPVLASAGRAMTASDPPAGEARHGSSTSSTPAGRGPVVAAAIAGGPVRLPPGGSAPPARLAVPAVGRFPHWVSRSAPMLAWIFWKAPIRSSALLARKNWFVDEAQFFRSVWPAASMGSEAMLKPIV